MALTFPSCQAGLVTSLLPLFHRIDGLPRAPTLRFLLWERLAPYSRFLLYVRLRTLVSLLTDPHDSHSSHASNPTLGSLLPLASCDSIGSHGSGASCSLVGSHIKRRFVLSKRLAPNLTLLAVQLARTDISLLCSPKRLALVLRFLPTRRLAPDNALHAHCFRFRPTHSRRFMLSFRFALDARFMQQHRLALRNRLLTLRTARAKVPLLTHVPARARVSLLAESTAAERIFSHKFVQRQIDLVVLQAKLPQQIGAKDALGLVVARSGVLVTPDLRMDAVVPLDVNEEGHGRFAGRWAVAAGRATRDEQVTLGGSKPYRPPCLTDKSTQQRKVTRDRCATCQRSL